MINISNYLGNQFFTESRYIRIDNRRERVWIEETTSDDVAISIVHLHDFDGKIVVSIGLNPRGDVQISQDERKNWEDYPLPSKMGRPAIDDNLEPTRRNAIYRTIESKLCSYDDFSCLVQLDLFSYRTYTAKERIDTTNNDANYEMASRVLKNADIIILGWGGSLNCNNLTQWKEKYCSLFNEYLSKCYVFGLCKSGMPRHAAYAPKNELIKVTEEMLTNFFPK